MSRKLCISVAVIVVATAIAIVAGLRFGSGAAGLPAEAPAPAPKLLLAAIRQTAVLLDLNMPRKDGREVLAEVKSDAALRRIPVVILTTSRADEDVLRAYDLHANCYVTKPVDFEQFMKIVGQIDEFWVKVVTLPKS